ncbi:hypothetical protein [Streptomyces sp. YIM S03343]
MRNDKRPLYALAAAVLVVGPVALGVPISTVIGLGLLAGCPLMLFFMMRGMHGEGTHGEGTHGGHCHTDQSADDDRVPLRKTGHQHPYGHGLA